MLLSMRREPACPAYAEHVDIMGKGIAHEKEIRHIPCGIIVMLRTAFRIRVLKEHRADAPTTWEYNPRQPLQQPAKAQQVTKKDPLRY